ncbi:hypothetical protein L6452_36137 [Arctium lappa]|uniref:Uncharacterized protein n=1 Tax=Arctium lappa TaxID=4217 RepID=A0ACB8Y8C3_ARCLA|nr:hypothetical protein L6452_36137 [Arctium lappa]
MDNTVDTGFRCGDGLVLVERAREVEWCARDGRSMVQWGNRCGKEDDEDRLSYLPIKSIVALKVRSTPSSFVCLVSGKSVIDEFKFGINDRRYILADDGAMFDRADSGGGVSILAKGARVWREFVEGGTTFGLDEEPMSCVWVGKEQAGLLIWVQNGRLMDWNVSGVGRGTVGCLR